MEAIVLHRVRFLDYFCPKQGQDFKPSVAPVYPNIGLSTPPPLPNREGSALLGRFTGLQSPRNQGDLIQTSDLIGRAELSSACIQ